MNSLSDHLTSWPRYLKIILSGLAVSSLSTGHISAEDFSASGLPLTISSTGTPTIESSLIVPDSDEVITSVKVQLDIAHSYTGDLVLTLIHPDGTEVILSSKNGSGGDNYTNTLFDQSAATAITAGSAPFTGSFTPEGDLSTLIGKDIQGTWKLKVHDSANVDGGNLVAWTLQLESRVNTTVFAVDFTSDGSGDAVSYSGVNPPVGSTVGYKDFAVAELGPSNNVSINPSVSDNGITFSLTGKTSAWPGVNGADSLTGDYLFIPTGSARLGADPLLQWSASGLSANTAYNFTFTSGTATNRGFTIISGDKTLDGIGGSAAQSIVLTTDASGTVSGSIAGTGAEGNLAALEISTDIPTSEVVVLPNTNVWQIDFQGSAGGAFGSANPVTASADIGDGATWNAFEITATNASAFDEPPTNHNAVTNPELLDLKDSNANQTNVALKFTANPSDSSSDSIASAYNVPRVVALAGIDHAYGDHWFFGAQGRDTAELFFQFENLPAGVYQLTAVVNPDQHSPDRDLSFIVGGTQVDIAPDFVGASPSWYAASDSYKGTINSIQVGSNGILQGNLSTLINEDGEVLGATDPSISAFVLKLISGTDEGDMNLGEKFRIDVLDNDQVNGTVTALNIISVPSSGLAVVQSDYTILYTHTTGSPSSDSFTYQFTDDNGDSVIGTVNINFTTGTRISPTTIKLPESAPASSISFIDAFDGRGDFTFEQPTNLATIKNNSKRFFVAERDGIVWEFPDISAASVTRRTFIDFTSAAWKTQQSGALDLNIEAGIKGLAFHPKFESGSPYVYVAYNFEAGSPTNSAGTIRLSRFTATNNGVDPVDMSSEIVMIEMDNQNFAHNIDSVKFGPDDYLYIGIGEDNRPGAVAQRINGEFWASILRIDVDCKADNYEPNLTSITKTDDSGKAYYKVPKDNPYAATTGSVSYNGSNYAYDSVRSEIYITGVRNPWQFSFDTIDSEPVIWYGDIGGDGSTSRDEINIAHKGDNLGWPHLQGSSSPQQFTNSEGNFVSGASNSGNLPGGVTLREPEFYYARGSGTYQGASVTGGYVVKSGRYSELEGKYIFGDWLQGHVWTLERTATVAQPIIKRIGGVSGIVAFIEDPSNGDVLALSWNSEDNGGGTFAQDGQIGRVFRIVQNDLADSGFPDKLSDTGIFADLSDLSPNPGVHAYEPLVTFWSDNAKKSRWFSLPNTSDTITFSENDQWNFPTGTTLVKHFDMEMRRGDPLSKKRLETRLLRKTDAGVYGVAYQWNEAGTEATLVGDNGASFDLQIDHDNNPITAKITQTWQIPTRAQCLACHTSSADYMLGINTRQLNNNTAPLLGKYGNYLTLLDDAGFFDSMPKAAALLPTHATLSDKSASLEKKARTYLDVNCAYCHRDDSGLNLRADIPLANMNITGHADTGQIDISNPDVKRVRSGHPNDSSILQRTIASDGYNRMPPIGSTVTDDAGAEILIAWIKQLGGTDTNQDWVRLTITGPGGAYENGNGSFDSSFAGDGDNDGVSNAAEVLLGSDLRDTKHSEYLRTTTVDDNGTKYREIEIDISDALADTLKWHLDKTTNLTSWSPLGLTPTTVSITGKKRTVKFRDPDPISDATPHRFYRLRVEAGE